MKNKPITSGKMLGLFCALVCLAFTAQAGAATNDLLERALTCKLQDSELKSLPEKLQATDSGFGEAIHHSFSPSFQEYKLEHPVTALGYTSDLVVLHPVMIMIAIPLDQKAQVEKALKLTDGDEYMAAKNNQGNNRFLLDFDFHIKATEGKLLIGCQYEKEEAASWGL